MTDFYIAASSRPESVEQVRLYALTLEQLGFEWSYNWTKNVMEFGPEGDGMHEDAKIKDILGDLRAARDCALFVAVLTEPLGVVSKGMYMEIGARLISGQVAHIVTRGVQPHFFFSHPNVRLHSDWLAFIDYLRGK